ncbi:MAG TPA: DUF58 domain-containing protein [Microbacteriaceae bacterium]|nr:DUF58 domain-containing protein [Microbacteriaceae bacterium]
MTPRPAPTGHAHDGHTQTGATEHGATGASTTRVGDTVIQRPRRARALDNVVFASRSTGRALGSAARLAFGWLVETVTVAGWMLIVVLLVGIVVGAAFGLVEGWVIAVVAAVLLCFSVPFLLGGANLDVRFALGQDRVVAGSEVDATITVANRSRRVSLPVVLDVPVGPGLVEAYVPLLVGRAQHVERLRIAAPRRGIIRVGPMQFTRGDPIGILRREIGWPQVEEIFVHPVTSRLPSTSAGFVKDVEGQPTTQIVDSDLAFHAIREYVPGDSRRHVHWKSTAKTGQLMVRQFEETRRARIAVILDVQADEFSSEDEFELGVSAATSLALQAVRDGREVLMVTSGRSRLRRGEEVAITTLPTRSPKGLLDATCSIELDESAERLEAVTRLTAQTFAGLSIAFMVTGSLVTMDRLQRSAFAFPTNATSVVVRVEPGAEPRLRATRDFKVLTIGALDDLKHLIMRGALG